MKYTGSDRLDCLIQMAYLQCGAKDAELFDKMDGSEVAVPKSLDRRIKRLIDRKSKVETVTRVKLIIGRIAIVAMLIMSIMFILLISVSGVREAIWRAIVEWHDNYITIHYEDPEKENNAQNTGSGTAADTQDITDGKESSETNTDASLDNKTSVTPPTKIEEMRKPSYVMDGVVEDVLKSKTCVSIDYISENDVVYSFSQFIIKENQKYFDNETATIQQLSINDHLASLVTYENNPEITIVWNDGEYVYVLVSSEIDIEKMITIAESVKAN